MPKNKDKTNKNKITKFFLFFKKVIPIKHKMMQTNKINSKDIKLKKEVINIPKIKKIKQMKKRTFWSFFRFILFVIYFFDFNFYIPSFYCLQQLFPSHFRAVNYCFVLANHQRFNFCYNYQIKFLFFIFNHSPPIFYGINYCNNILQLLRLSVKTKSFMNF